MDNNKYVGRHRSDPPVREQVQLPTGTDKPPVSRDVKVAALALYLNIPTEDADLLMQEVGE